MIRARQFQCGGVMGRKETEEAIADSRAGRVTQFGSVAELMADLNADDTPDQVRARYMSSNLSRPQAAMGCVMLRVRAAFCTSVRSGLRVTVLMSDQSRVGPDQRRGLSSRAWA